MPSTVQVSIEARDNASATLEKVRQQLELFPTFARNVSDLSTKVDAGTQSWGGFEGSLRKVEQAARRAVVPLVSELSPALGQVGGQMGQVISSSLLLGSGLGAVTLIAAGLAGVVGGALITSFRAAATELREFNVALTSTDTGLAEAKIKAYRTQLDGLQEDLRELTTEIRRQQAEGRAPSMEFDPTKVGPGDTTRDEAKIRALQAKIDALTARIEQQRFGAQLETEQRGVDQTKLAQRGLYDFRLRPEEAERAAALRAAEDLAQGRGPGGAADVEGAARLRQAAEEKYQEALRLRRIEFQSRPIEGIEEAGRFEGISPGIPVDAARMEKLRQLIFEIQRREFVGQEPAAEPGLDEAADFEGLAPQIAVNTRKAQASVDASDIRDRERGLQIDKDRLLLQTQRVDLSTQERAALDAQAIQADYLLKVEQARLDPAKLFSAEVEKQVRMQQLLERTDAVAGLKRGISDIEQEFGNMGTRMQSLMQNIGGGMAGALDNSFFNVITNKFEDMPAVAARFGQDMVRAFTGELSKMATSAIFGQLRTAFEGIFPGGGPSGTGPFGAGSGGGPATLLTASGRPLSQHEIDTAYAAEGEAGVRALRSGQGTVVGGEFISAGGGMEQVSAGAGLLTPAAGGFNLRSGLGIAGSAALLGLTTYGATGARTTGDVVTGAAAGAISGAALGSQVGEAVGYGGAGTAIGAVLGALVTGTIAALGKAEADKEAKRLRQQAEIERAAGAGSDLVRSAGSATSLSDLFRRLTAFGSGYTGGTANPAVPTSIMTATGAKTIGVENPYYPVATLSDLLAAPGSIQAGIQAGVDPAALAGPNAATSSALQKIATDMVDQFRQQEQGVGVTEEDVLSPSGLVRRTTHPASLAGMLTGEGTLEIDELALHALDEEDQAVLLLDVLAQAGGNRDIVSTVSDGATGQIVSITRIPRSTSPLPPATSTAPPAGVPSAAVAPIQQAAGLNLPRFTEPAPHGAAITVPTYTTQQSGEGDIQVPGPDRVVGYQPATADQLAAYEARRDEFYRPFVEQLATSAKDQLAGLTLQQIQAAINGGLLTPSAVAALSQAGLLPQVREVLPPEVQAALDAITSPGGGGDLSNPGLPGDANVSLPDFGLPSDVSTAISNAIAAAQTGLPNIALNAINANPTISFGPQGFGFSMTSNTGPGQFGVSLGDLVSLALGLFGFGTVATAAAASLGLGQGTSTRGGDFSGIFGGLFGGTANTTTADFSGVNQSLSDSLRSGPRVSGPDNTDPNNSFDPAVPSDDPTGEVAAAAASGGSGAGDK